MKYNFKLHTIVACLLLLASCSSSLVVQSDTDSKYDISAYKSFTIVTPTLADQDEMISINPILIQRISRSLESALTQKGLFKSDKADMTVRFYIGTMREIERATDLGGFGYYRYGYLDSRDQRFIRSEKDEISIRFHDTETNDVVWYAFTRFKRASDKFDQAGVDSLIQEVLTSFN